MNTGAVLRGVQRRAEGAADTAVTRVITAVATRADVVPGVAAEAGDAAVILSGRGLAARAFGSRRRAADPAILGLTRGDGR
ncbi:MAG: hypothetical protein ACOYLS_00665 [Polymorphobacter sp.]